MSNPQIIGDACARVTFAFSLICLFVASITIGLYAQDPNHYVQRYCALYKYSIGKNPAFWKYDMHFLVLETKQDKFIERIAETQAKKDFYNRIIENNGTLCYSGGHNTFLHKIPPRVARNENLLTVSILFWVLFVIFSCACCWANYQAEEDRRRQIQLASSYRAPVRPVINQVPQLRSSLRNDESDTQAYPQLMLPQSGSESNVQAHPQLRSRSDSESAYPHDSVVAVSFFLPLPNHMRKEFLSINDKECDVCCEKIGDNDCIHYHVPCLHIVHSDCWKKEKPLRTKCYRCNV
jgi:hypothetical protein